LNGFDPSPESLTPFLRFPWFSYDFPIKPPFSYHFPISFPAAPQHVVLDEARRRLAVVHPAAQRRDELRRLDGAGAWAVAKPWTCGTVGNFSTWEKRMEEAPWNIWKIWTKRMKHMEDYGKLWKQRMKHMEDYGKLWKQIEDLTDVH
jgi:hypothetical protein